MSPGPFGATAYALYFQGGALYQNAARPWQNAPVIAAGILLEFSEVLKDFYSDVAKSVGFPPDDSVLVVCGGPYDSRTLAGCGLKNVIISNVDHHDGVKDLSPFSWEYQDAEAVDRPDQSVDWAVVNAGLHHCASPHKALCEMLRISRKGVLVLEARDSRLMRLASWMGLSGEFETAPALLSDGQWGGYRNTNIPNYVYRWTEREFEKTVMSYAPHEIFAFEYRYGYRLPLQRMAMSRSFVRRAAVKVLGPMSRVLEFLRGCRNRAIALP